MTPLILVLVGGASTYSPGDGHNAGTLSCGGRLTWRSRHIAIREWRRVGCGARARVCSAATGRCAWTAVRDSGPWGAVRGGEWQVQIRLRPGWRRRGVVDLAPALWRELGRPRFLSQVRVEVYRRREVPNA